MRDDPDIVTKKWIFACHKHFHCTAGVGVFVFVWVAFSSFPPFTRTRSAGEWSVNDCGTVVAHCIGGVENIVLIFISNTCRCIYLGVVWGW
jgi:hypothetical protein